MDIREKLDLLGAAARYDDCRASAPDAVAEGRGFFAPETTTAADPRVLPCVSHLRHPGRPTQSHPQGPPNQRVPEQLQLLRVPGRP